MNETLTDVEQTSEETGKAIASQAGHWYYANGSPCYDIQGKNGKMRPTTLADARKLDLVPSVTLILKCAAAPGLEAWKAKQLLESALTLPKIKTETLDDYAKRVIEDSKEQGRKAAERGTELHKAIEDYIRGQQVGQWAQHCAKVRITLEQYGIDIFKGKAEHSFASPLGYGGKIDWHNDEILIDFKTRAKIDDKKQLAWPENVWQLAAYDNGIWQTKERCSNRRLINVFIGCDDCEVRIHEHSPEDAGRGWQIFQTLLRFWQLKVGWNGAK